MQAPEPDPRRTGRGVYGISVTAELSGVPPPTLRLYERHGLLSPARTDGGTRRYSDEDLARVQRITELADAGINLAAIAHILQLETANARLKTSNTRLVTDNARLRANLDPPAEAGPG